MTTNRESDSGNWEIKFISLGGMKLYPPKDNTEVTVAITKRLEHVEERIKLRSPGKIQLSMHSRGFNTGQIHGLISERYFLETLLEKLEM